MLHPYRNIDVPGLHGAVVALLAAAQFLLRGLRVLLFQDRGFSFPRHVLVGHQHVDGPVKELRIVLGAHDGLRGDLADAAGGVLRQAEGFDRRVELLGARRRGRRHRGACPSVRRVGRNARNFRKPAALRAYCSALFRLVL